MNERKTQTVDDVKETFRLIRKTDAQTAMARAMLLVGNLTEEAKAYVRQEFAARITRQYPQ